MLILVFRGIFLIGILSWYSTNVCKMIDGYFKDRFEKYLQQEYEKNPKMRDNVDAYRKLSENDKGRIAAHVSIATRRTKDTAKMNAEQGACETPAILGEDNCAIDFASREEVAQTGSGSSSAGDGHAGEIEVSEDRVLHKKNSEDLPATDIIVSDIAAQSLLAVLELNKIDVEDNITPKFTIKAETFRTETTKQSVRDLDSISTNGISAKKSPNGKLTQRRSLRERQKTEIVEEEKTKKKKKQNVKTITLTDENFKQAKLRAGMQDYDFSEFDDDNNDSNEASEGLPKGILISQLPLKPRADIGNLERVTHEEFCPLTLEDAVNCGESKTWP